jgi:predicted secreted protein
MRCIFVRARVLTLSTNLAKPHFVRRSVARIVDDWRAVRIDIIDNRSYRREFMRRASSAFRRSSSRFRASYNDNNAVAHLNI